MASGRKLYTQEILDYLRSIVKGKSSKELAVLLSDKFNITFTAKQIQGIKSKYGICSGLNTTFKKGSIPHNKGKRMPEDILEKIKPTLFQKGHLPKTKKPIGAERVSKDGYLEIKVSGEKYKSAKGNKYNNGDNVHWITKQQKVWIDNFGDIPKDHKVVLLDGNKRNFDIKNLACISEKVHLRMCLKKRYNNNRDITNTFIAISSLENAIYNKKKN